MPLAPTGLSRATKSGRCSLGVQMLGDAEPVSRAAFMQRLAVAAATVGAAPLSSARAADATEIGDPAWAAHDGPFADSDFADFQTTASGLKYKDVVQGDGAQPAKTDTVRAYYAGYLLDGKLFDTSYRPALFPFSLITPSGPPTAFKLGRGGLIPGFEEGAHICCLRACRGILNMRAQSCANNTCTCSCMFARTYQLQIVSSPDRPWQLCVGMCGCASWWVFVYVCVCVRVF